MNDLQGPRFEEIPEYATSDSDIFAATLYPNALPSCLKKEAGDVLATVARADLDEVALRSSHAAKNLGQDSVFSVLTIYACLEPGKGSWV